MAGDRRHRRRGEDTASRDANGRGRYVSTGHLPSPRQVQLAVDEAYRMYRSEDGGAPAQTYPALARVPTHLFGICVAGIGGNIYRIGDAGHEFTIMSVAKPFVFALVCQLLGAEQVRHKLGVNATGLAFDSLAFVERSADGRSNPMVAPGPSPPPAWCPVPTARRNGGSSGKGCPASPAATWR
jgi:glutaminase